MGDHRRSLGLAYLVAVVTTAVAVMVRWLLDPWLSNYLPLPMIYGAVAFTVWYGGYRPALLATALGYAASSYLFIEPRGHLLPQGTAPSIALTVYLLSCLVIIGFGEGLRVARRRLETERSQLEGEVAQRRQAVEALQAAMQQLQIVTDSMSAPVTRCSRDFRYLWVSKRCAEWLARPRDEIVGRPILDILGAEAFAQLLPYFQKVLAGERVEYEMEVNYRGIGRRWIHAIYTPTMDPTGVVDGWVAVIIDIHERKLFEESLRHADRRKNEFLAMLAHELRNPLAPIRNAVHILKSKGPPDAEWVWSRDVIDRQVQQMTRLVDDLLDVSRISRNRLELRRQRVELAAVVDVALETSRPLLEASGHALTVTLPPEPIWLDADPVRLAQVFSNLLNNAAKYTAAGGHLHLAAEHPGSDVVVAVKDNGIGIAAEILPHIFEMFSQATPALDRSQGGLGIGLSLVKGLVELHGGSIVAHSDGLGEGSEFVVRLPVAVLTPVPEPAQPGEEGAPPGAAKCRLLIVDDLKDSADSLAMMLRLTGHEVQTAYDGEQAIEAAGVFRPDVVLLDIEMPKLNGYDACRRIREQPWGQTMYLVALTGWGQEEDRRRTEEAGFHHHVVKPVDPAALMKLLAELHLTESSSRHKTLPACRAIR